MACASSGSVALKKIRSVYFIMCIGFLLQMDDVVAVEFKVEADQQVVDLVNAATQPQAVGDRTAVKTEEEPTRWIVCGNVVKLERRQDLVQQGRGPFKCYVMPGGLVGGGGDPALRSVTGGWGGGGVGISVT